MLVAQITKDHIADEHGDSTNREFDLSAMLDWWGWDESFDIPKDTSPFKMYDDDGELYYEGWLCNDDQCVVQQFVLAWGGYNAGCTTIKVNGKQEIG